MFWSADTTSQTSRWRRSIVAIALAAGALFGASRNVSASPYTGVVEQAPPKNMALLDGIGIDQNLDALLPLDAAFTDDYGKKITLGELFGPERKRPAVLVMVYYQCPVLCNMVLNDLIRSMNGMKSLTVGQDFDVVTVSIDPSETPDLAGKKKRAYMKEYGHRGDPAGWHFLTGTDENIKKVAQTVGFKYRYDAHQQEYIHASGIMIITPQGHVSRYFYGIDYSPKDLRLSLVEASENKIGGLADAVLLYCFHYDPASGKYGLMISNILKLTSGMTLVGLGTLIFVLIRRERRQLALQPAGNLVTGATTNGGGK